MTKLSRGLSSTEVVKALQRVDFQIKRQKGSRIVLRKDQPFVQVVVPAHRSIDTGTLAAILDGDGITAEAFIELL